MSEEVKKKKTVSHSQFSNWWTCPYKWYRDYILHEKIFEDSLHMCFGTGIHESIQDFLKIYFAEGEVKATEMDMVAKFIETFKREIDHKKIKHTQEEFDEFIEDGKAIIAEFRHFENIKYQFPRDKWELLGIETEINEDVVNNVNLTGKLDMVFREKLSGNVRIVDFKTATTAWNNYKKEDFTKTSQLVLYKAIYSKKYSVPLNKINVEFIILCRKLYAPGQTQYKQSRIQIFKPSAYQADVLQVIQEFRKFVEQCFTPQGVHNTEGKYPKIPGKNKKNCKYCPYLKNKKCNGVADAVTL